MWIVTSWITIITLQTEKFSSSSQLFIIKCVDQKSVAHLHNGILHSRKKGAPTLRDSIVGTGEHYAK